MHMTRYEILSAQVIDPFKRENLEHLLYQYILFLDGFVLFLFLGHALLALTHKSPPITQTLLPVFQMEYFLLAADIADT